MLYTLCIFTSITLIRRWISRWSGLVSQYCSQLHCISKKLQHLHYCLVRTITRFLRFFHSTTRLKCPHCFPMRTCPRPKVCSRATRQFHQHNQHNNLHSLLTPARNPSEFFPSIAVHRYLTPRVRQISDPCTCILPIANIHDVNDALLHYYLYYYYSCVSCLVKLFILLGSQQQDM